MNLFSNFDISASAMTVQRTKLDVISTNLANIETTNTPEGGPYKKQTVIVAEKMDRGKQKSFNDFKTFLGRLKKDKFVEGEGMVPRGVEVIGVIQDETAVRLAYMPGHPHADDKGYVSFPDINIVDEMVQMIKASRMFEANLAAFNESKTIFNKSLEIGKG